MRFGKRRFLLSAKGQQSGGEPLHHLHLSTTGKGRTLSDYNNNLYCSILFAKKSLSAHSTSSHSKRVNYNSPVAEGIVCWDKLKLTISRSSRLRGGTRQLRAPRLTYRKLPKISLQTRRSTYFLLATDSWPESSLASCSLTGQLLSRAKKTRTLVLHNPLKSDISSGCPV